ncbi:acyl carrier protein [Salmonella enterica subsp. enterica]|uniref:Acyl carrier protein n=1 Tax=Salmonella enterica I TaxID=59201 RepID=A0A447MSV9_SALET|nr:acyl carrier protein [Salmonella enterica subsp. enterica]
MVAKISAFTGRAIPVVGWIILASDVSQIAYRTVRDYNRIARGSDKNMVSDTLEQRIYELVRSHDGIYLFKKKELTPSTDLDSDLRLEDDEALALMDDFFTTFNVDRREFLDHNILSARTTAKAFA